MVRIFSELSEVHRAGGKGRTLALMRGRGLKVPDGLIILPEAFENDALKKEAVSLLEVKLPLIKGGKSGTYAVRSSAEGEDSADHSFAGEFDSLLHVKPGDLVKSVEEVYNSRNNSRVKEYAAERGIQVSDMAVVIQPMIDARFGGVLFSADPVTRRFERFVGNAVAGTGEGLVSGEEDSLDFSLERASGLFQGPAELKKPARKLFGQIHAIEKIFAGPVDVEWAWDGKRIHILQARSITTLSSRDPKTGGQNDSLRGCMLWSNNNVAEAVPDIMTPATWSLLKEFHDAGPIPWIRIVPGAANIAGRPYMNISYMVSIYKALGKEYKNTGKDEFFGNIPENLEIPLLPQRKKDFLPPILKARFTTIPRYKRYGDDIPAYLEENPHFIESMKEKILSCEKPSDLVSLWEEQIFPHFIMSCRYLRVATILFGDRLSVFRKKLNRIVGGESASDILSDMGGSSSSLVSLNLVKGVYAIEKGELTREDFIRNNGFRGPHEFEISIADMQEEPSLLEDYLSSPGLRDPEILLKNQKAKAAASWLELGKRSRGLHNKYRKEFEGISAMAGRRERVRAEMIRTFRLFRVFYLKAGWITGLGDDLFFLSYGELIASLKTGCYDRRILEERKRAHEIYSGIPYYPPLIKGPFDPVKWWNSPDRRADIADSEEESVGAGFPGLKGQPASCGIVEAPVRIIGRPEEGRELKEGEILVASTTNIGWTPYFLRAAGVITDVGAPLSHAAIVARELGIPAIVGCGHASTSLKTGDRIRMNGGTGSIEILSGGEGA
ncbi:MAG: hypothetical protein JXR86_13385 [Spirochaetales bacterium]|nr:hypothetical protein [Spirochaetales bacterium]